MNATAASTDVSILCLSWINAELRKEIAKREAQARRATFGGRFTTSLVAAVSAVAMLFYR